MSFWANHERPYRSRVEGVDALVEQANRILENGFTEDRCRLALSFFEQASERDPEFVPVCIGLFHVRLALYSGGFVNRPSDATERLRSAASKLLKVAPAFGEAQIAASFNLWIDGRGKDALERARIATQRRTASKSGARLVHGLYGWYLIRTGDYDAALKELHLAERVDPTSSTSYRLLGEAYSGKRDYDKALWHFRRSIELEPRQVYGYYCLAKLLEGRGHMSEAIAAVEEGRRQAGWQPATIKPFYDELRVAFQRGGETEYWRKRIEEVLSPHSSEHKELASTYPHELSVGYAHLGDMDEAYRLLEQAAGRGDPAVWLDSCWDQNSPEISRITRKLRLKWGLE
jgi:hypothetical protein